MYVESASGQLRGSVSEAGWLLGGEGHGHVSLTLQQPSLGFCTWWKQASKRRKSHTRNLKIEAYSLHIFIQTLFVKASHSSTF